MRARERNYFLRELSKEEYELIAQIKFGMNLGLHGVSFVKGL